MTDQNTDHIGRLETELEELRGKIARLKAFMETVRYQALDKDRRHLLCEQCGAMTAYENILDTRLKLENGTLGD